MKRKQTMAFCLAICTLTYGCAIGPPLLKHSNDQYNRAINQALNDQLLLNLVRLRYRDTPLFLEIGNVSAQFQFGSSADASGTIYENVGAANVPNILKLGAALKYDDKPTISFTPLQGEDFVERLMSPLELDTILLLYHSGWSVERIFRLAVQGVNELENAMGASGPTPDKPPIFEDFAKFSTLLRKLQTERLLNIGYETTKTMVSGPIAPNLINGSDHVAAASDGLKIEQIASTENLALFGPKRRAVLTLSPQAYSLPETRQLHDLLNLSSGKTHYELTRASAPARVAETDCFDSIFLNTRSLLGILFYLSHGVEIPDRHQKKGFVTITKTTDGSIFDWADLLEDFFHVRSSKGNPSNAAVAVKYRGRWFYIDDRDLNTKSTFALLTQIFSLQAGQVQGKAPVLTLSVGG